MKKILTIAALAWLAFASPKAQAQQAEPEPNKTLIETSILEDELRKYGPWLPRFYESDFTDGVRTMEITPYLVEDGVVDNVTSPYDGYSTFARYTNGIGTIEFPFVGIG